MSLGLFPLVVKGRAMSSARESPTGWDQSTKEQQHSVSVSKIRFFICIGLVNNDIYFCVRIIRFLLLEKVEMIVKYTPIFFT